MLIFGIILLKPIEMNKLLFTFCLMLFNLFLFAQNPYIMDGPGDGLGQYGYLELDAITFANLNRSDHGNVKHLGARWWVTDGSGGQEYVYWTTPNDNDWQCNGDNSNYKATNDYNPANFNGEWIAGSDCYVSVYAEYCDGVKNPNGGTGIGYNERQFKVLDLDNTAYAGIVDNVLYDAGGDCNHDNLVGSFTIDPGSQTGIELKRFWFKNTGTAEEGTHIPNDAFKVFYEPSTGSETFDKTESSFMVYGDYNSNSTSNNVYGNDAVSASINGKTRFYVTICKLNMPAANTKTVELVILNDGISFSPDIHNHNLFRVGETNISNKAITIPITLLDFSAEFDIKQEVVRLDWSTTNEINSSHFNIMKSRDALVWKKLGIISSVDKSRAVNKYSYVDKNPYIGLNYYKLEQVDFDGKSTSYGTVSANVDSKNGFDIYPNPVDDKLMIISKIKNANIEIINNLGIVVRKETITKSNQIDVSALSPGIFYIVLRDNNNEFIRTISFIKR